MKTKKNMLFLLICILFCLLACDLGENYLAPFGSYLWRAPPKYDDSNATRTLNVAAVSFDVDLSSEVNRQKMIAFIDKIKTEKPDVRLILFPETVLGYYYRPSNSHEYQKSIAETIPGITTNLLSQKAIEHQVYISFGMVQNSNNNLYNAQVLIDPNGTIISIHHKNYLIDWDIENGFNPGNGITLDIIDNIKVATIICYDSMFHDIYKMIHNSGAELVLIPLANVAQFFNVFIPSGQFVYSWALAANRIGNEDGNEYDGLLFLNTPSGETKAESMNKEGYIYGMVRCR